MFSCVFAGVHAAILSPPVLLAQFLKLAAIEAPNFDTQPPTVFAINTTRKTMSLK
jgi:hypothetical protein